MKLGDGATGTTFEGEVVRGSVCHRHTVCRSHDWIGRLTLSLHIAQVPHGHGTAVYRSGWMYEGGWLNGKESGWGVLSDARDVTLYVNSTCLFC